jgi:carboxyl-terminal processing protease
LSRSILLAVALLILAPFGLAQAEAPADDAAQEGVRFARVYAAIEQNYVDSVDPDQAILEGGIRGMLSALDPFSSFFNPDQFKMLQEQARGQALGFGSVLFVQLGKIVVLQTAEGSPSWRAGLGPGDEIVSVNGTRIVQLDFNSLVELLQRSRSQPVTLGVVRPGKFVPEDVKLVPAEVALPTVDKSFLLPSGVGYIHISGFEGKTPQEVADALQRLGGDNRKGVLLDLRDNHGGIVNAAVATASLFLKPNQVVLAVKGRGAPEQTQRTLETPVHFDAPLVVLVNDNTASAAEIFAAALEEHDRAVIVGQATFGKGVVQSVMPLSEKCGLALTTAQYFTASGRSIQRPLPGTALAFQEDSMPAQQPPAPLGVAQPVALVTGSALAFHTDIGRPVSAGGGIVPDVPIPGRELDPWVTFVNQRGFFTSYASEYLTLHGRVNLSFEPDDKTLEDFRNFLTRQLIRTPEEYWTADLPYVRLRIKAEVLSLVFGLSAGDEVEVKGDPQVESALALFDKIPALLKAPGLKKSTAHFESVK